MQPCSTQQSIPNPIDNLPELFCLSQRDSQVPPVERNEKSKQPPKRRGNRVLMIGLVRELALYRAEVLRHSGYQVATPQTVEDAFGVITAGDFDAVILSYTLPNEIVQELAEKVREQCPDCPIVAITDHIRPDRRIEPDAIAVADQGPPALVAALGSVLRPS